MCMCGAVRRINALGPADASDRLARSRITRIGGVMAKEVLVVLNRSENSGFGFSLLGQPGLPPIIYDIVEDSPAAECGEVEVGDVILKVNETDVNRYTTKEVLRCLRLSSDPVTLKLKRDPQIKACVWKQLTARTRQDCIDGAALPQMGRAKRAFGCSNNQRPDLLETPSSRTNGALTDLDALCDRCNEDDVNGDANHLRQQQQQNQQQQHQQQQPTKKASPPGKNQPKFEAFMMTGEHILNLSRMQQSTLLLPKHQKKIDSLRFYNHTHNLHLNHHNSVPTSPNEMEMGHRNNHAKSPTCNSAGTSPVTAAKRDSLGSSKPLQQQQQQQTMQPNNSEEEDSQQQQQQLQQQQQQHKPAFGYVRTSRSEDHLQLQKDASMSAVDIDVEDDVTSSLNTLLDTRQESSGSSPTADHRIVWTYNAPVSGMEADACGATNSNGNSSNTASPTSSSPLRSASPASPTTSVSSSVMSSHSGSRRPAPYGGSPAPPGPHGDVQPLAAGHSLPPGQQAHQHHQQQQQQQQPNGDLSISEAMSNMSSPDYRDEDILNARDFVMEISDHSDSDSTLLVSESGCQRRQVVGMRDETGDHHRIVIQVRAPADARRTPEAHGYQELHDNDEEVILAGEDLAQRGIAGGDTASSPPPEDESDIDSLHSFHYSPKAVDIPSAIRLAKRLYSLDGFKKSDVSRHLSKNNDFSRAVAEEYLKYFNFESDTLDIALRKFLKQFALTGETQERERVLVHFSKRYLDCNPGSFNSQDAVHTLTCAIMLLNTDLHGQNIGRKMTCLEFIDNLAGLNERKNFDRDVLKHLYTAIKNHPLEWALDEEGDECAAQVQIKQNEHNNLGGNPFLDVPNTASAIEYKKGYVMRKCCYEANAKKTPFHKRSWKMFYCTLRDLILYLHKDEHGFRKGQLGDNLHNAIRIHHALATKATDYTKKQYVFRLQTADQAEYLFQTSDPKELQSWIDTINFVCASFSSQPLEAAVGSQKKFQRPLLPCTHTKFNLREQLRDHEDRVIKLETELDDHRRQAPEKGAKALVVQNYKEKDSYLRYELNRYRTYAHLLRSRMSQYPELEPSLAESCIGEVEEVAVGGVSVLEGGGPIVPPPVPDRRSPPATNRSFPEAGKKRAT